MLGGSNQISDLQQAISLLAIRQQQQKTVNATELLQKALETIAVTNQGQMHPQQQLPKLVLPPNSLCTQQQPPSENTTFYVKLQQPHSHQNNGIQQQQNGQMFNLEQQLVRWVN